MTAMAALGCISWSDRGFVEVSGAFWLVKGCVMGNFVLWGWVVC